jgi:hypothetical protein
MGNLRSSRAARATCAVILTHGSGRSPIEGTGLSQFTDGTFRTRLEKQEGYDTDEDYEDSEGEECGEERFLSHEPAAHRVDGFAPEE